MLPQDADKEQSMSRREVGRLAVAAAAGAVLSAVAPAAAQSASAAPAPAEMDPRVALLEKALGRTLSEEQRKMVAENIKGADEAWTKGRAELNVADGTEPDFVFRPTPLPARARQKGNR